MLYNLKMFEKILFNFYKRNTLINKLRQCRYCSNAIKVNEDVSPESSTDERILKVAIIGIPNAGKSTFINNLMDRKVCATSSKAHTTRTRAKAIFTEGNSQIVFLDTPGLVNQKEMKRFNLEKSFSRDYKTCLYNANLIGVIHDVSNIYTKDRLDVKIVYLLEEFKKKPSILILNKVDMLKTKRKLLDTTRLLTEGKLAGKAIPNMKPVERSDIKGWPNFQEIFMVSSLTGTGLDDVKNYFLSKATPGKWLFPDDVWTDQSPDKIILNAVKGRFLDFLQQEIPYSLKYEVEFLDINEKGVIKTVVLVTCPTNRIEKLIAGINDGRLKQITESVQEDLQKAFLNYVRINIVLQSPPEKK